MVTETPRVRPYQILSRVYDRWDIPADRGRILESIRSVAGRSDRRRCLDLGCGTGTLMLALRQEGFDVCGVDSSPEMLSLARARLAGMPGPQATLVAADIVDFAAWPAGPFDVVVSTLDTLNYLSPPALAATCAAVGRALDHGGVFLFDINTPHKLRTVFGASTYAQTFSDYAYIWRNVPAADGASIGFEITLFLGRDDGRYERHFEEHRQYIHEVPLVVDALRAAGFESVRCYDDYQDQQPTEATMRVSVVAHRPPASAGTDTI